MSAQRNLTTLPIFTEAYADCGKCGLKGQCNKGMVAYAYRPVNFNGMMIIGEGPGQQEIAEGRPFVGQSGKLLRALLESIGIAMDECYITNATLCKPPPKNDALHKVYPEAVSSCLSRLEAEIEAVKPRVIVTLGAAAMISVIGYDNTVTKRTAFDCVAGCDANRKIGPVLECLNKVPSADGTTAIKCGHTYLIPNSTKDLIDGEQFEALKAKGCTACGQPFKGARPKMIKCPSCGGRKMRDEQVTYFEYDYDLYGGRAPVAGAVFQPAQPGAVKAENEIASWFGEQGVRYMVPTYHPAFLLRDKQFLAKAVQKHLSKAAKLLKTDLKLVYDYQVTSDPEVVKDFHAAARVAYANLSCDIETEAFDDEGEVEDAKQVNLVSSIKCLGLAFGAATGQSKALVIDTREASDALLDAVQDILEDEAIPKTWHNGACYDLPVIALVWGMPWEMLIKSYWDDTIAAHTNLYPDEPHKLAHVTFEFLPAAAWKPARTSNGAQVHESFEELALYNARDVIHTDHIREAMGVDGGVAVEHAKMHRAKLDRVYEQDAKIRQIAVSMTMRGMPVDEQRRKEAGDTALRLLEEAKQRAIEALKTTRFPLQPKISEDADGYKFCPLDDRGKAIPDFNPFAVKNQLIPALFSMEGFGLRPLSMTQPKNGPPQECTDGTDLLGIMTAAQDPVAAQFIQAILDYREHSKIYKTYIVSPKMQPWVQDGRVHPIWKPWGARTGRFSSSPNCFDGATEVLTEAGWVRFDQLQQGVAVAQWDLGNISFVQPTQYIRKHYSGNLVALSNIHIDLLLTPEHRCLLQQRKTGKLKVFSAEDYPEDYLQLHGGYGPSGPLHLSAAEVALYCATQADAHYTAGHQIVFGFDKLRKVHRMRWALDTLGVDYTYKCRTTPTRTRHKFTINRGHHSEWLKSVLPEKRFTNLVLRFSAETRRLFCEEVFLWDGCALRMSMYSSVDKVNADWVQTMLTLEGHRARIRQYQGTKNIHHQVDVTWNQNYSMTTTAQKTRVPHSGDVYCLSVPSSYLLVRRNGCTMVTGQCQNWPKWLRAIVVAPKGRKIVGADFAQIELRGSAAITGDPELIRRCLTADEARKLEPDHDPHSYVASVAFGGQYTSLLLKDPAHDKENNRCKCQTCKRKALRDLVKRVIYGLNYGAGDAKVLEAIYSGPEPYNGPPITLEMVAHIRKTIFKAFPKVLEWRENAVRLAQETQEIRSPILGRRRVFPFGDIPPTEIYNFPIQSMAAEIMNERTILLYEALPSIDPTAFIFAQVHDAIYVECDENKAEAVAKLVEETLTCEKIIVPGAPVMVFNASAAIADDWKAAA